MSAAPLANTEDATLDSYVQIFVFRDFRGCFNGFTPDMSDQKQTSDIWKRAAVPTTSSLALKLSGKQEVESLIPELVYPVNDVG